MNISKCVWLCVFVCVCVCVRVCTDAHCFPGFRIDNRIRLRKVGVDEFEVGLVDSRALTGQASRRPREFAQTLSIPVLRLRAADTANEMR